jgi:predicted MFS family arabinose efflux permease
MTWFLPDAHWSFVCGRDRISMANRFARTVPPMRRLLVLSVAARLPVTMLSLGLLVHAQRMTGSFAVAGLVSGAYAAGLALGSPLLGRRIDACGQTRVLAVCGALCGAAVVAAACASGAAALIGLAAFAGVVTPPVGACVRSLLSPEQYGIEATASEFTWIAGPPSALALGALTSSGVALGVAGIGLAVLTTAFALEPASRAWRPSGRVAPRGGALRSPAMRVLVAVMALVGVLFGAAEVGVTAAAHALGSTAAAGPLMGIWGAGSVAGGLVLVRSRRTPRLAPLLLALALSHAALALGGGVSSLAALLALAGATIAPTYATAFGRVDRAAPQGTATEAFAWLNTAVASGSAAGAALAGALADGAGAPAVFILAGAAGIAAAGIAAGCARQSTGLTSSTGVPSSASM